MEASCDGDNGKGVRREGRREMRGERVIATHRIGEIGESEERHREKKGRSL